MIKKGKLQWPQNSCYLGFDAEWTKNYKIKNGNVPFCFSIVAIESDKLDMKILRKGRTPFQYIQFYSEDKSETRLLIENAEKCAEKIEENLGTCKLCGHQISSDFGVLINIGRACGIMEMNNLMLLRREWRERLQERNNKIVDTRYDVQAAFMGKSRRLVDICRDFNMDVSQPELMNFSMTKLQNMFWESKDKCIYERIAVMNIRHSLCSAILAWLATQISLGAHIVPINVNKILQYNLKDDFSWIQSDAFKNLI